MARFLAAVASSLAAGQVHFTGPLLPNLEWQGTQIWEIRERNSFLWENNEYVLDLKARFDPKTGEPIPIINFYPSLEFIGHFWTTHARVAMQQDGDILYYLRRAKAAINPFQLRDTFRIVERDETCTLGWCGNDKVLFTIMKDFWGQGVLWLKEEWRVYRGLKKQHQLEYYALGSYYDREYTIWHTQEEKDGDMPPCAQLVQRMNGAWIHQQAPQDDFLQYVNNQFKLIIQGNEDTGLLTTLAAVIDIVHDVQTRAAIEREHQEEERERRHRRHRRHGGGEYGLVEERAEATNAAGRYRRSPSKGKLSLESHLGGDDD